MRPAAPGAAARFFAALQLSDSAFPAGLFTQSAGLETAVAEGRVADEQGLTAWVDDVLALSVAPLDGRAAATCWRAAGRGDLPAVLVADRRLEALRTCREPREASARSGRGMLAAARAAGGAGPSNAVMEAFASEVDGRRTPGHHAAVLGVVGRTWGAPLRPLLTGLLFAAASGAVGAAVRLRAADHLTAQRVLTSVRDRVPRWVSEAARPGAGWWSFAPGAEIMAMRHEAARVRLFTT